MWPFCKHAEIQIVKSDLSFYTEPYKKNVERFKYEKYTVYHARCYECGKIFYERHRRA